ncbi:hypothetical protein GCM10025793_08820 [Lysobacter lycopersici]
MTKFLAIVIAAVAITGCAGWPEKPRICFASEPLIAPGTAAETRAIEFVKRREASSCRPANVECDLRLRRDPNGEITIISSKAFFEGGSTTCTRLEGGFMNYVFSPKGVHVRTELGL